MADEEHVEKWGGRSQHPNNPYPNPVLHHEKLLKVWNLAADGYIQTEIAEEMGLAQATISKYLKQARELFTPIDKTTEAELWLQRWDQLFGVAMTNVRTTDGTERLKWIAEARMLLRDRAWFTGTNAAKKLDITWGPEQDEVDEELQEMIRQAKAKNAAKEKWARDRDA